MKVRSATSNLSPEFESTVSQSGQEHSATAARAEMKTLPPGGDRDFAFAILLSALRCTAQYVLLPFVLPWLGVAASIPPWLTLALSAVALISLVRNLRYLWRMRYSRRWSYLGLALVVGIGLIIFVGVDLRALLR